MFENIDERKVQNALGSLNKYLVTISIPVLGYEITEIMVKAENEERARERALGIANGDIKQDKDDEGSSIDWTYEHFENNGEPETDIEEI